LEVHQDDVRLRFASQLDQSIADGAGGFVESQLPEIAGREPGYLAQHLSEAGRTSRAAQMWLEAAMQAAGRSANLEAIAQLDTALDEIRKLPAGPERDNLESVSIAQHCSRFARRGLAGSPDRFGRPRRNNALIFQPIEFRNPEVKSRVFRHRQSSTASRFSRQGDSILLENASP
jgi:hypothetical protein